MRSRCFILAATVALSGVLTPARAHAQVLLGTLLGEKLSSETFNIGFEVGVNFSNLDGFPESDRMNRTVFGLFADWRFSRNLHLGGAVLPFAGRGAKGLAPVAVGDPEFDAQTAGGSMDRSLGYVEIPVLLKWAPERDEGFRVGAGPSLGIVTGATDRYETATSAGTPYTLEHDIADELPGLDVGMSVDVEWRLSMLAIAVRYTHGLTDMRLEGAPEAIHSRVLTGTGRIYLGKKPAKPADDIHE